MRLTLQHIIGALIGGAVSGLFFYALGIHEGKQQGLVSSLETSVKTLRDKGKIYAQISNTDAADLCGDYGLPNHEQAECVRRVRAASAKP